MGLSDEESKFGVGFDVVAFVAVVVMVLVCVLIALSGHYVILAIPIALAFSAWTHELAHALTFRLFGV